jgi:hypothetical protein
LSDDGKAVIKVNAWRWWMCYKFCPVFCPQFITWKVSEDKRPDKLICSTHQDVKFDPSNGRELIWDLDVLKSLVKRCGWVMMGRPIIIKVSGEKKYHHLLSSVYCLVACWESGVWWHWLLMAVGRFATERDREKRDVLSISAVLA